MKKIMTIFGTRPEAIKLAPIVSAIRHDDLLESSVVVTAQHRKMLEPMLEFFSMVPDHDLDIFESGQTLADVTTRALGALTPLIGEQRPDMVVVQGDTTTTFAAALAAYYNSVPVAHVEAGLRTHDRYAPYPEEINRCLTTQLASLHLAPTLSSKTNLLAEGVQESAITVTGNPVIDALLSTLDREPSTFDPVVASLENEPRRVLLVTAHRRESWGPRMEAIGRVIADLARTEPDILIIFPIHRNPVVREAIVSQVEGLENVSIIEPLGYPDFVRLMQRAHLVLTDSGGLQEEAPSLGKPVLVMRDVSERPEAIAAGTVRIVGTDEKSIGDAVRDLLHNPEAYSAMAKAVNPYGDGRAAARTVAAIKHFFELGPAPEGFQAI